MWIEIVIILIFLLIVAIGVELTQKLKVLRSNFVDNIRVIPQTMDKYSLSDTYIKLARNYITKITLDYDTDLTIKSKLEDVVSYQKALMVGNLRDQLFEEALQKFIPLLPAEAASYRQLKTLFPYLYRYPTYFNSTNLINMIIDCLEKDVEVTMDYLLLNELSVPGMKAFNANVLGNISTALTTKFVLQSTYYAKNTLDNVLSILPNGGFNVSSTLPNDMDPLLKYINIALCLKDSTLLTSMQKMIKYMDFQQIAFPLTDYPSLNKNELKNTQFLASLLLKLINKTGVPKETIVALQNMLSSSQGTNINISSPEKVEFDTTLFSPVEVWAKTDNQDLIDEDLKKAKKIYSLKTYFPSQNTYNLGTGLLACSATFFPFNFQTKTTLYTESNAVNKEDSESFFNFVTMDNVPRHRSLTINLTDKNYTLAKSNAGVLQLSRGAEISFISSGVSFDAEGAFKQYCYMDNNIQSFCVLINSLAAPSSTDNFIFLQISSMTIPDITASNLSSLITGTKVTLLKGNPFCVRINNKNLWMMANALIIGEITMDPSTKIYTLTLTTTEFSRYIVEDGTVPLTFYMFSLGISERADNLANWQLLNHGTANMVPTLVKPNGEFAARIFLYDLHKYFYNNLQFVPYTISAESKGRMMIADDGGSMDLIYSATNQNENLISVNNINTSMQTDGNLISRNLRTVFKS